MSKELIIKYRNNTIAHLTRQNDNSVSFVSNKNMQTMVERWIHCGYNSWIGDERDAVPRKTLAIDELFFEHIKEGVEKKFPEYSITIVKD